MADMSRPGENTPLSLDKGEARAEEKERETNSKQPGGDGDQLTGTRCDARIAAAARTPGARDEECCRARLNEAPVTRSNYGSVDVVKVCQSCQHLYDGASEVVLSPSRLETDPPLHSPASHKTVSMHRPWTARRYENLCDCGASVSGGVCVCPERATGGRLQGLLSSGNPCLKKVKIAALVVAALLPWVFLVSYIVLTNI